MRNQSEVTSTLKRFPRVANPSVNAEESVSVVIPCYNEANFIGKVLENLADQYESDRYEIIVVDGRSEDRTREEIEAFKSTRPELSVVLVDNPARNIPAALNLGVAAARGEIIARMDAHAVPSDGYVRRCVEVLSQDGCRSRGYALSCPPGRRYVDGACHRHCSFSSFRNWRCEVSPK